MTTQRVRFLWLAPLCLAASVGSSLLVTWALSGLAGFRFDPSLVSGFSAMICSVYLAKGWRQAFSQPGAPTLSDA